jgi:hypothetical protein
MVISLSIVVSVELIGNSKAPAFFVGVEYAYSYSNTTASSVMVNDAKALVDKVKNYTNLFIIGTPQLTFNETALNETCDYIRDAGLYFIVLLTGRNSYSGPNQPFDWLVNDAPRYGDRFLGVYRFDEPGGNQLDQGESKLISVEDKNLYNIYNSQNAAAFYTFNLQAHIEPYANATVNGVTVHSRTFTADYGLYWFDYSANYDTVFAEFGSNQSRELTVALCRGAANAHGKDWGAIITWEYDKPPYIESADALYNDLTLAYNSGAKYAVVFDYPKVEGQQYGILTEDHFDALKRFWNDIHSTSQQKNEPAKVAYVLQADYGFGFRNPEDTIWGLWSADNHSAKIYNDAKKLIDRYNSTFDIVHDDPQFRNIIRNRYETLIFWNETVT